MAVLVTRPHPDNETTAAALRARGFDVAAGADAAVRAGACWPTISRQDYAAVIVTRPMRCAPSKRSCRQRLLQAAAVCGRRAYRLRRARGSALPR